MLKLTSTRLALFIILFLGGALRIWGIAWGLPSAYHYYPYHPDEYLVAGLALSMDILNGSFLPHFYHYGSLQLYLINFANIFASCLGFSKLAVSNLAVDYAGFARVVLIARLLTACMGVGTIWVTFAIGRRLWNSRAGLIAALLLAIMPLHVQHSHWSTVDVPGAFWVMSAILWAVHLAQGTKPILRAAVVAGVFAGLAAATKYNFALAILPIVAPLYLRMTTSGEKIESAGRPSENSRKLCLAGMGIAILSMMGAFLIGCPGALLDSHRFLSDFRFEANHVTKVPGDTFEQTGNGFVYHIATNLTAGLGWPLFLLTLVSLVYAIKRRERGDGILAAFAIPYYTVIALAAVRYARYDMPMLPLLALWGGRAIADWLRSPIAIRKYGAAAFAGGVSVLTLGYTLWLVQPMTLTDPRDQAMDWVVQQKLQKASFAFPQIPWFQTVPLSPYFAAPIGAWQLVLSPKEASQFLYRDGDWNQVVFNNVPPPVVVVSEYDYKDAVRLQNPTAIAYLKRLKNDYQPPITFGSHPLLGRHINLPHDMLYTDPIIQIYCPK